MATQGQAQVPLPVPRRVTWKVIAIAAIIIALLAIGIAIGSTLFGGSAVQAPSAPKQNVPPATAPDQAGTKFEYAASIPGNGFTFATYTEPGKPGQMTDGGQIAASFILLASYDRVNEALQLGIGSLGPSATLENQAKALAVRGPLEAVTIDKVRLHNGAGIATVTDPKKLFTADQGGSLMVWYQDVGATPGDNFDSLGWMRDEKKDGVEVPGRIGFSMLVREGKWIVSAR